MKRGNAVIHAAFACMGAALAFAVCGCGVTWSSPSQLIFKYAPDYSPLYGEFTSFQYDQDERTSHILWSENGIMIESISEEGDLEHRFDVRIVDERYDGYYNLQLIADLDTLRKWNKTSDAFIDARAVSCQIDLGVEELRAGNVNSLDIYFYVYDGADDVSIYISGGRRNTPPIADAGIDQTIAVGDPVTLDGTASSDADGDEISYAWSASGPSGPLALSEASGSALTFTPLSVGEYTVRLVVKDNFSNSFADTAVVTVE